MNEPTLLWGALAVVVPIAIHFWHRKQGKPLPWAATQWLEEKQQQQSRGLRLDNVWLMVLRCLLVLLLAVLLAQPMLNFGQKPPVVQRVHLVQPSAAVVDNFRFELTDALKKEERVLWANNALTPVQPTLALPEKTDFNPLTLQTDITNLSQQPIDLQLYAVTGPALANVPAVAVPARFGLHTVVDSSRKAQLFLVAKNGRRLFINRAGKLVSSTTPDASLGLASSPILSGPIATLLDYPNGKEKQTVKAALAALSDVYGLDFQLDERPTPNHTYAWVLTNRLPAQRAPATLYIVSSAGHADALPNVVYTDETLTPTTSERVETGQLPEWLGTQLLTHTGLMTTEQPLSPSALRRFFLPLQAPPKQAQTGGQNLLLLVIIGLVILERWLALSRSV